MCGICGLFQLNGEPVPRPLLAEMTRRIAHRGPDSDGFHYDDAAGLGLGFRRLAIIDLQSGDQPIYNENRQVVTIFNGEIYNYRALRHSLQAEGHLFSTQTDSEVLVHGYEAWGTDLPRHLRGMFAFAIWDAPRRRLFLARDPLGEKPLYYAQIGKSILFASEIKAFRAHPAFQARLNRELLPEYLALGYVLPPATLFEGVQKLAAGTWLCIDENGIGTPQTYWTPHLRPNFGLDGRGHARALRQTLEEAVALRLMSDVPLGTFLSGGVDSTTITALTSQLTGQAAQAFTVGFDFAVDSLGDRKFNADLHAARLAARHIACQPHEIILRQDALLAELLPQLIYALDEPIADSAIFQTSFVAALARTAGVPVLLSGDGADEPLGGYPFFQQAARVQRFAQIVPRPLRQGILSPLLALAPIGELWEGARKLLAKAALKSPSAHFLTWEGNFSPETLSALTAPLPQASAGFAALHAKLDAMLNPLETPHMADQVGYAKLRGWLAEDSNMRYDKICMWMSIEGRAPFQDPFLVQQALNIPLRYKLHHGGKAVLKEAVRDLLPPAILDRPKWGFNPPLSDWLRTSLRPLLGRYLTPDFVAAIGLDKATVARLIDEHQTRQAYHMVGLWNLLVLALWFALYIEGSLTIGERWSAQDLTRLSAS